MFSLGMVIHFMAFRGDLPYIAKGETLDSLNDLRQEVQNFQGYKVRSNDPANGKLRAR